MSLIIYYSTCVVSSVTYSEKTNRLKRLYNMDSGEMEMCVGLYITESHCVLTRDNTSWIISLAGENPENTDKQGNNPAKMISCIIISLHVLLKIIPSQTSILNSVKMGRRNRGSTYPLHLKQTFTSVINKTCFYYLLR